MTLDEAIAHAEEVASGCGECADEHRQLAGWLRELVWLRQDYDWVGQHNAKLRFLIEDMMPPLFLKHCMACRYYMTKDGTCEDECRLGTRARELGIRVKE